MTEHVFTNVRILLAHGEVRGTFVVRDGLVAEYAAGNVASGFDGEGAYLMPGLVELHTDNLERCAMPRPQVEWPIEAAVVQHDREIVAAGITTVCDAIGLGGESELRSSGFAQAIDAIDAGSSAGRFAADHRLHLRCELTFENASEAFEAYARLRTVALVSIMDHTPGQRQFVDLAKFKAYYSGKHGVAATEMDAFIDERRALQVANSDRNRRTIVALARELQLPLATHDDADELHVREALDDGATICEFPTTLAAATAARGAGMHVIAGAPNLVLGGSHSGNVAASDLLAEGLADLVSSDYVPHSLLQAAFIIARIRDVPLYRAIAPITSAPARAIGLEDRGTLEAGERADFITVTADGVVPRITSVHVLGQRVA